MATKPRGRPRSADDPEVRTADEAIARTCWMLVGWGWPLDGRVAPCVATLAASELKRTAATGQPLSTAAVKRIYLLWLAEQDLKAKTRTAPRAVDDPAFWTEWAAAFRAPKLFVGEPGNWRIQPTHASFAHSVNVDHRRASRPPGALADLAKALLRAGGYWRGDRRRFIPREALTAKAPKPPLKKAG